MKPGKETALNEKDLLTLQPAWRSYFVFYTAIFIFGLGPAVNPEVGLAQAWGLVLSVLLLLFVIFRQKTTFYLLTPEAALRETRFAGQVFNKSLPLSEVVGVAVRRGAVHRLLGIGHIQLQSRTGRSDLWWYGLADPFATEKRLKQLLK
jgi:hypothetical protein